MHSANDAIGGGSLLTCAVTFCIRSQALPLEWTLLMWTWLPGAADIRPPPGPGVVAILPMPLDDMGGLAFQSEKTDSDPIKSASEDGSAADGENASDAHTLPERNKQPSFQH